MSELPKGPFRRKPLAPYEQPRLARSLLDVATSVVPYLALSILIYTTLGFSDLPTIAVSVLAASFLVPTFIVFHDCAHGSMLPSKRQCLSRRGSRPARAVAFPALAT